MPISPTWPTDGQSDWDVPLLAGLGEVVDEINAHETDIAAKLDMSAAPELIRDTIGTALVEGTNVTITVDDVANTITIDAAGGGGGAVDSVNGATGVVVLDQDDVGDGTTYKQYSATEKTKLAGIATGATANDTDANLKARANHTGTQTASTISDFDSAARTATASDTSGAGLAAVNTVAASGSTETLSGAYALHKVTMDQNCTFTFTSPSAGAVFAVLLSGAFTPTFPGSVDWPDGTPPTYSTPSLYVFSTFDAGTTWYGVQAGKAFA